MKIVFVKKLSLDGSNAEIDLCADKTGDSVPEDIFFQIGDASGLTLTVKAQVENSDDYEAISFINMATMQTVSSATADGLYVLNASGLSGVKFCAVGSCDISVKAIG